MADHWKKKKMQSEVLLNNLLIIVCVGDAFEGWLPVANFRAVWTYFIESGAELSHYITNKIYPFKHLLLINTQRVKNIDYKASGFILIMDTWVTESYSSVTYRKHTENIVSEPEEGKWI